MCNRKLSGVVTFGPRGQCGHPDAVGVYVRIPAYYEFLKKAMDQESAAAKKYPQSLHKATGSPSSSTSHYRNVFEH